MELKKLLLILMAIFISAQVVAQHRDEVVYLKNGSEIRGTVIQYKPGEKIRIQTRDGSLFVYQMDEVDHLSKNIRPRSSTSLLGRGYRGFADVGITIPFGFDFTTTHGYQIDKHFFVGAGVGCNIQTYPLFATARYDILDRHVTPALEVRWGHSFGNRKSPYFSLTGGVRIRMGSWGGFNISCGYLHHAAVIYFEESDTPNTSRWDGEGCIVYRIGFEF